MFTLSNLNIDCKYVHGFVQTNEINAVTENYSYPRTGALVCEIRLKTSVRKIDMENGNGLNPEPTYPTLGTVHIVLAAEWLVGLCSTLGGFFQLGAKVWPNNWSSSIHATHGNVDWNMDIMYYTQH